MTFNYQRAADELHQDNRYRKRPPVTLPGGVTFTFDAYRAVYVYAFDARITREMRQ